MVTRMVRWLALAGAVAVALVASGCGSGSKQSGGSGTTAGSGSASLAEAQAVVDKALSPKGTFKQPAGDAPAPKPGATIALISCGQQIEGCAEAMASAAQAAQTIGWKTTLFDTKGDPTAAGSGIRQAIARKADGIYLYAIDCQYAKAPLEEAKAASIPVFQSQGMDCSDTDPNTPSLFSGSNVYSDGEGFFDFYKQAIAAVTDYAIVRHDGSAHVMFVGDDTLSLSKVAEASARATTAGCGDCSYTEVTVPLASIGTKLQGTVQQKLLQNPDTNTIIVAYQDLTLPASAAVRAAGRQNQVLVSVGEGGSASMDLVRGGAGRYVGTGFSNGWEGWAAIDGLNRLIAGGKPANSGIGVQLFDAEHNVPASGPFEPPIDFQSAYKASWGVRG